ncbi:glycyl-radical enzyme activating protein [Oscillospiraceae bacterium PP1C4]
MNQLNVMEIERFAVHDGPGIRTVVFLKGCGMHCPWCANPESQSQQKLLMHDAAKCTGCGACAGVCKTGAISFVQGQKPLFDRKLCTACGSCSTVCMQEAIAYSGQMISSEQIVKTVMRDADYYEESGGGVTLSGGEPMCHGESLVTLLRALKEKGLHIAVETCGQFDTAVLEQTLSLIDLFLFDIKHTNPQKLKEVTGGNAEVIFGNLALIAAAGKEIVARVPVIPGFNHSLVEMQAIFEKAVQTGIKQVDLLPYHTLGKSKYAKLGREYTLTSGMLTKEDLGGYLPVGEALGLTIKTGG